MNIKTFKQYSTGGFSYLDENNNVIGTGTVIDSAAPDPDNFTGVYIYCQNPSRTLYTAVSPTSPVDVILKDGTTTSVTTRKKLMEDLAEFFFYRVTSSSGVQSVTGLDTDNSDPQNPIVKITVDDFTIIGEGTPLDKLAVDIYSPLKFVNTSSTQWSKTLPAPVTLNTGQIANGFTFFSNSDKVTGGTTVYNEFFIDFGITVILSGTNGTANIKVNGTNYLATFNTSLYQTALDWVNLYKTTLQAQGIDAFALGSGTDGRIRFGSNSDSILNNITITNILDTLNGSKKNEFTNLSTAAADHVKIPYLGQPYDGQRILHTIRTNFNIQTGSVQYCSLGLFRYENDSLIGSSITILRNPDVTGVQTVLETYTNNFLDPFVIGGFYVALVNNTGTSLNFIDNAGILIQNIFQKPCFF